LGDKSLKEILKLFIISDNVSEYAKFAFWIYWLLFE